MTRDFLSEILKQKRVRLERTMLAHPLDGVVATAWQVRARRSPNAFTAALSTRDGPALIAEFKRASPSRGPIKPEARLGEVALAFENGGAAAISVLTEEDYFAGSLDDLRETGSLVSLPVLRKDFIFDSYQVYESAAAGADALLLIAAALDDERLRKLRSLAEEDLQMDALVEVHTVDEMRRARDCRASLIGVNNRNLTTLEVSLDVSMKLVEEAPAGAILVSESGLRTPADIRRLHELGYKGFLIGETLMTSSNPAQELRRLLAPDTRNKEAIQATSDGR